MRYGLRPSVSAMCRVLTASCAMALLSFNALHAQESPGRVDPQIAAALREVSAERIQGTIEKLVGFGTRSTLSAQDPASIRSQRGIGAAREWIRAQFLQYAKACGGCLDVRTDVFTQAPVERVPQPTQIVNVYAVMKGSDAALVKRVVLVTGHYDSRATDVLDTKSAAPGA